MTLRTCEACGKTMGAQHRVCQNCGATLPEVPEQPDERYSNKYIWIGLSVLAVLLVAGVLWQFVGGPAVERLRQEFGAKAGRQITTDDLDTGVVP